MRIDTDRIEKTVVLRAPLERVWQAITDADEFGRWFGARFDSPFERGARVTGTVRPTEIDPAIAAEQEAWDGVPFVLWIETVDTPRRFAFRWHPGGDVAATANAPFEETTLVTFELEALEQETRLTIRETGFDAVPLERRARAFADNDGGWEAQTGLIAKYLARAA